MWPTIVIEKEQFQKILAGLVQGLLLTKYTWLKHWWYCLIHTQLVALLAPFLRAYKCRVFCFANWLRFICNSGSAWRNYAWRGHEKTLCFGGWNITLSAMFDGKYHHYDHLAHLAHLVHTQQKVNLTWLQRNLFLLLQSKGSKSRTIAQPCIEVICKIISTVHYKESARRPVCLSI